MSSILPLAAFHGESGPRRHYAGVARISGMDVVRIFGTSTSKTGRTTSLPSVDPGRGQRLHVGDARDGLEEGLGPPPPHPRRRGSGGGDCSFVSVEQVF